MDIDDDDDDDDDADDDDDDDSFVKTDDLTHPDCRKDWSLSDRMVS